jgi:uncharacterized membrane protein HdeD (DUF308 family)
MGGMTTPRSTSPAGGSGESSPQASRAGGSGQPGQGEPATPTTEGRVWERGELAQFAPDLTSAVWPAFMAASIGCIVVGVILLAWPKATLMIVAVLIGIALIVAGVLRLMDGFTSHDASGARRAASVVIGLLAVILGLYCIRDYHFTITALAIITGLFWVIHGISDITVGLLAGRFTGRGFIVLSGVLSLCAGLIVLFWPVISLTVLVVVTGIWLIVYGILAGILAFRLRRSSSGESEPDRLAAA